MHHRTDDTFHPAAGLINAVLLVALSAAVAALVVGAWRLAWAI